MIARAGRVTASRTRRIHTDDGSRASVAQLVVMAPNSTTPVSIGRRR